MDMGEANTGAVLNKPSKHVATQIILNNEAKLGLQIVKLPTEVKDLLADSQKLEADRAIVRNVMRWLGIHMSVGDNLLEQKFSHLFQEIGMDICNRDIRASHCLKDKDQTIVKLSNRKDSLRILRVKDS